MTKQEPKKMNRWRTDEHLYLKKCQVQEIKTLRDRDNQGQIKMNQTSRAKMSLLEMLMTPLNTLDRVLTSKMKKRGGAD